jgi:anti-sigma-K factor RskA
MTCEELQPEYGAYALGSAENPERIEISEHLARNCPNCTPGVGRAMETVSAMGGAVKAVDPPKRLRKRVVAMVSPTGTRSWAAVLTPWAIAGVLAIALISVVLPSKLRTTDSSKLEQALSILNDPTTKDVSFGQPTARGRVFVSREKGVVFIAAHLPPLDANRTFEIWFIPAQGNPIPAGLFRSEADASAIYVRPGAVTNAAAVAVTVEPAGGSPQPTSTPFIVTKL